MLLSFAPILGLALGSFLNVCIVRLPKHESIVKPRSRCPQCGHELNWYENIPLLSYLYLRGRCRHCQARISIQYPLVELGFALWFTFWIFIFVAGETALSPLWGRPLTGADLPVLAVGEIIFGFLSIGLLVMDWQTHKLSDAFTLPGILLGMMLICTRAIFLGPGEGDVVLSSHHLRLRSPGSMVELGNVFLTGPEHLIYYRLFATAGAALLLLAIRGLYKLIRKREGMGLGDVKLLAMIAAFLGFWPAIVALFAGVLLATAYAAALYLRRKADALTELPFGSFLAVGGLLSALFGERIVSWYTALLH